MPLKVRYVCECGGQVTQRDDEPWECECCGMQYMEIPSLYSMKDAKMIIPDAEIVDCQPTATDA